MKQYIKAGLVLSALLVSFSNGFSQQTEPAIIDSANIVVTGATPQKISSQFTFTEGPAVAKNGDIYFTDQPNDKIWKFGTDGTISLFMDKTGRSNGLYFDKKGNIISCADEKDELWSISPDKKVTVLMTDYQGQRYNGPNDLWLDGKGGIYFTDPYYQRDYWERKKPDMEGQKVYYLPKGRKEAIIMDAELKQPNGIVGTPDGKHLYVADIRDSKTYKYEIASDGRLTNRQLFVSQGSDGMTLDSQGNVYLTGKGITVYNPTGKKVAFIPIPSRWAANLCFGGKDRKTLFITATESVYTLPMQVKGVE